MHSCLTLVDYTWKDSDDRTTLSSRKFSRDSIYRLRRSARSLDGQTSLKQEQEDESVTGTTNTRRSLRCTHLNHFNNNIGADKHFRSSLLLLASRKPPIYAASRKLSNQPDRVWVPVGHCRYLLERDLLTGEIKWTPEANELLCTPRTLAEICMARLIRDWPCVLPPRRSSLRNMVSFLVGSMEYQPNRNRPGRSLTFSNSRSISTSTQDRLTNINNSNQQTEPTKRNQSTLTPLTCCDLPFTVLLNLLTEAILQRDCAAITGIIANWSFEQLIVRRLIPTEDYPLTQNYMTKPTFVLVSSDNEHHVNRNTLVKGPSLLDAFILGFLTRQSTCKLKSVDFTGFEEDSRVSIELSRLPILWMKPENRNSESVRRHLMASLHIGIPKKRLEAYFNRIATIYKLHEADIGHGEPFETVTIHLDCNMTVDEVALGLSLQTLTPFRFSCNRLLLQRLQEIHFPPYSLIRLFDPLAITQFELEDPTLGSSLAVVLPSAVGWLISLRNLRACSLPSCIPPPPEFVTSSSTLQTINNIQPNSSQFTNTLNQMVNNNSNAPGLTSTMAACKLLNRALISLRHLQRLGLARCHLTGQLKTLLGGLSQPLEYLNLQDCRLAADDIHYLVYQWRPLNGLYELNLSRNNLSTVPDKTLYHLIQNVCFQPQGHLTCLSIAYTCLSIERIIWLLSIISRTDESQSINELDTENEEVIEQQQQQHTTTITTTEVPTPVFNNRNKCSNQICTLRVLCIQSFIPPAREQLHRILHHIITISKLQKLYLFPAFYAFPADTETSQRELRKNQLIQCHNYLRQRSRDDIEIL